MIEREGEYTNCAIGWKKYCLYGRSLNGQIVNYSRCVGDNINKTRHTFGKRTFNPFSCDMRLHIVGVGTHFVVNRNGR